MIRKLILSTAAVMALSAGAQAGNTSTVNQMGLENNSSTVQSGVTSNTATLTQAGFFNNGSAGQTSPSNTSTITQGGFAPFTGAASNAAAVGQNGTNLLSGSNSSTITQTSSVLSSILGGSFPPNNSANVTQINALLNGSSVNQTENLP
jgi:Curlin associated repeat